MSTLFSIAQPSGLPPLRVTACLSRLPPGAGVFFAGGTLIIRNVTAAKLHLAQTTCRSATQACSVGTKSGVNRCQRLNCFETRCSVLQVQASNSGRMSTRMSTCIAYVRVGNEPHLLGHQSFYLSF